MIIRPDPSRPVGHPFEGTSSHIACINLHALSPVPSKIGIPFKSILYLLYRLTSTYIVVLCCVITCMLSWKANVTSLFTAIIQDYCLVVVINLMLSFSTLVFDVLNFESVQV